MPLDVLIYAGARLPGSCGSANDLDAESPSASLQVCRGFCGHDGSPSLRMSCPPNGRALAFPVIFGPGRESSTSTAQPVEVRTPTDEDLMAGIQAKDAKALDL